MSNSPSRKTRKENALASLTSISTARIEAALEASYEIEVLALHLPEHEDDDRCAEYIQRLFKARIKALACVVMSALTDDRETEELRGVVGLKNSEAAHDR